MRQGAVAKRHLSQHLWHLQLSTRHPKGGGGGDPSVPSISHLPPPPIPGPQPASSAKNRPNIMFGAKGAKRRIAAMPAALGGSCRGTACCRHDPRRFPWGYLHASLPLPPTANHDRMRDRAVEARVFTVHCGPHARIGLRFAVPNALRGNGDWAKTFALGCPGGPSWVWQTRVLGLFVPPPPPPQSGPPTFNAPPAPPGEGA